MRLHSGDGWIFALLVFALPLSSQTPATLRAGQRIRVTTMNDFNPRILVGRLVLVNDRGLTMWGDAANPNIRIPEESLYRVEASIGADPRIRIGLPVVLGAAAAIVAPHAFTESAACEFRQEESDCEKQTPDGVIGFAIGAVGGMLLGRLVARERWRVIPLRWVIGAHGENRFSLAFRIAF